MKSTKILMIGAAICLLALVILTPAAYAQTITDSSGQFTVGIGPNGELYNYDSGVGFMRNSDSYDPLAPGTPRDSWGASNSSGVIYADQANLGSSGVTTVSTIGAHSATLSTTGTNGLDVTQKYNFAAPNVLQITETVTNASGAAMSDVQFQRDVDWDVYPTEYNENTFAGSVTGNVIDSSYNGFENPTGAFTDSCAAGCNQVGDWGGGILLDLGALGAGASDSFNFLYAISQTEQSADGLDAQLYALGAYYIVTTQSSENGSYPNLGMNSAAIAVSNIVPEPSSLLLLGSGLAGLVEMLRRRVKA